MKQLKMRFTHKDIPQAKTPEDYSIIPFCAGDEQEWLSVVRHGLFPEDTTLEDAIEDLERFSCLKREQDIFFAVKDGKRHATATGMMKKDGSGYLHYICALPEARGTGVAAALITHAAKELYKRGASYVYLTTDDFRLGAIKTYLRIGLTPVIEDAEDERRWMIVRKALEA